MIRRFRRRPRLPTAFVLLILALVAWRAWRQTSRPAPPELLPEGYYQVERVVDGDTLLLANQARVRLQGVDTPETKKPEYPVEPWGPEASRFTVDFVADGKVKLEFDVERLDKYDRFLAYVYKDGRMLNEELVRAGLATAELGFRYSDSKKRLFKQAEDEAKAARRGIWSQ